MATPVAEPIVKQLHKLVLVQCGDQGGMIGSWMQLFSSRETAMAWYAEKRKEWAAKDKDIEIFEEDTVKALVLADGKTAYEIKSGPLRITQ